MKKILIALGIVLGLFVMAAIVVPLVVDVDKYRPQIVSAANEKLNGKLELGKLSLSLWGQIRIDIAGLSVTDARGAQVFSVSDAYFHVGFFSILTGSPDLTFKADHAQVSVSKDRTGKLNLMTLMKVAPATPSASTPSTPSANPSASSSEMKVPSIVAHARLGIDLHQAAISYKDLSGPQTLETKIEDLNFVVKDLSLSHPTDIQISADLHTTLGKTFALKGPMKLTGHATPTLAGGQFNHLDFTAKLDMNSVAMEAPGVFVKKPGMACNADLAMTASAKEVKLTQFHVKFFNAEVSAEGSITNLSSPIVNLSAKSNDIDFKPWVDLVPMLKEYDLGGTASFSAKVEGPSTKLDYAAQFKVNGLTARAPHLKAQPRIDALVSIITDQMNDFELTMKAPGNDLSVKGKLVSFTKPNGAFNVASSGMDLDQLIDFPPPGKAEAPGAPTSAKTVQNGSTASSSPAKADLDASVAPLRENKMLAEAVINIPVNIKFIKAQGVRLSNLVGKIYLNHLVAGVEGFDMGVFGGTIKASLQSDLKPRIPSYKVSLVVDHLDIAQAVESQMAMFKNTVLGIAHFEMNGNGSSFNSDAAMSNLNARGNMKVTNATFTSVDVGKMVADGLNKGIDSIGQKIPAVKGKAVGTLPGGGSKYDLIVSDFTIANGKFSAPNFVAKATPNQGIDLKGNVAVGIKDKSLDTNWEVTDTYNLTRAKDIAVDIGGVHVDHVLAEGNGPVKFPIHAGCTIVQPCYSYNEVAAYLAKVAIGNATGAATGAAKNAAVQQAQRLLKNSGAPAPVQNALDQLKNKFHF